MIADLIKIIRRAWNLVFFPRAEWYRISIEKDLHFFRKYFIFFITLTTLSYFLGVLTDESKNLALGSIAAVVKGFGLPVTLLVISTYLIYAVSPLFDSVKNISMTYKLVIYSLTPYLMISLVSNIFPALKPLNVLGLFGAVLMHFGMDDIMKTPHPKHFTYLVYIVVVILGIFLGLGFSLNLLATVVYHIFI